MLSCNVQGTLTSHLRNWCPTSSPSPTIIHDEDMATPAEAVIAHPLLLEAFNLLKSEDEAILEAAVSAILAAINLCSAAGSMAEGYKGLCMYLAEGVRIHCLSPTA